MAVDPNAASCTVPLAGAEVSVAGGDLDDTLAAEPFCPDCDAFGDLTLVILDGGGGADTLVGGRADMRLSGGGDDDLLQGGPFGDVLVGGAGSDMIDGRGNPIDPGYFVGDVVLLCLRE